MLNKNTERTVKTARPQDLRFSTAALDRAFGKKMTHAEYLQSLKRNFGKER